jgi:subtilisin family serine protease
MLIMRLLAAALFGAFVMTAAAAAKVAPGAEWPAEVAPFRGKVDRPDVIGGYASTHVIAVLKPGVEAGRTADDRHTLARRDGSGELSVGRAERDLAAVFERWRTAAITRTLPFVPANRALADELGLTRTYFIHVPRGTDVKSMAAELARFTDHVEHAHTDGVGGVMEILPNDPSFNLQYGLRNTGQTIQSQAGIPGADIKATLAWDVTTGSPDVIIAVIDTGIMTGHPEFAGKLVPGYNAIDGSSSVGDSPLIPHGTHVSGIAAANTNNATGVAGVSWGSKIMPVKVLNIFGGGTETDIANGVIWAADNGANIANMSLGVPDGIPYFQNACAYAYNQGVLLVAASGNTPGAAIPPPARWPTVMAVGATDNRDQLASFTTTGPEMSVSAPGVNVYSTWMTLFGGATYSYQSGTSMAAPHVAGLASLALSVNPSLTNGQLWNIIEQSADDKGTPGWNPQFGHGRINALAAVLAASPPGCVGDLNGDGSVDVLDLLILLDAWGPAAGHDADLNGDDAVDVLDLLILLDAWGPCP